MTIGILKEIIKDLPEDLDVLTYSDDWGVQIVHTAMAVDNLETYHGVMFTSDPARLYWCGDKILYEEEGEN